MAELVALSEYESKRVLEAHGLPVAPERLVQDLPGASAAAAGLGWPVVVKACGAKLSHKTERGLVAIGVADEATLERSVAEILGRLGPDDGETALLVAAMVKGNRELICGVENHEQFGPVIMVGLGGILAEALGDVVFRSLPISRADALEMVAELKTQKILGDFRGEPPADRSALAEAVFAIGEAAASIPDLSSLDVNPLILVEGRPVAVDALIVTTRP